MIFFLTGLSQHVSPELMTVFIASLPISELRGAIPYAIAVGGLSWQKAYILAVLGNFIPVVPVLLLLESVSSWLMQFPLGKKFFTWLFERTRKKGKLVERFEAIGLMLFVAIPLPITGAWTGCVAAFIFNIRLALAIPCILAGILIAGAIVTLASLGVISFWGIG